MSRMNLVLLALLVLLIPLAVGLYSIGLERILSPLHQNVQRQVFEETKSYVHGKVQDLARYYEEYQSAKTLADKEAVANVIKIQFADFDANDIKNPELRRFLVSVRGF